MQFVLSEAAAFRSLRRKDAAVEGGFTMVSKSKSATKPSNSGAAPASRAAFSANRQAARKETPAKKVRPPAQAADGRTALSEEELKAMISRAAYLRAEKRGFEPGHEEEDWLAAEAEIRNRVSGAAR
jgi:hypothetical protein